MKAHRMRWAAAAAATVLVAGALATVSNGHAEAAVPAPPGWNLVWADDFNGAAGTGVNTANWRYTTGTSYPGGPPNFGTGEIETMTSSTANVSLDGAGNLRITPLRNGAGQWTSGRIETNRADFQPLATGKLRVEARIQMPNITGAGARGYWPAFWMLGAPYRGNWWNWPMVGEIDILENVQGINNEWATMHCGTSPGGPCNEKSGIGGQRVCAPVSCQAGFHTYTMEWDRSISPQQIRWYLDGAHFHTVSSSQVPANVWADATNHGFFIILNVAMGGEFPAAFGGGPDGATVPGRPMVVDYVAVWSAGAGGPPPTNSPPPTQSPPPTCGPLISQGRPVTASSIESPNQAAAYAVDGNVGTRWSSAHNEPNWLQVDLGSTRALSRVRLNWETAYGRAYEIQLSTTGTSWTTAYSTFSGAGGIEDLAITGSARYVRMNGLQRATPYGFSLWEFQVYGACTSTSPTASTTVSPPPTTASPAPTGTGAYPAWASGVSYAVGQRVSYGGRNYSCRQAHTSQPDWTPTAAPALWLEV